MADILDKIMAHKSAEIETTDYGDVRFLAECCSRDVISMSGALRSSNTGIIAEFKRQSPSKGWINEGAEVLDVVAGYNESGATACSVLTDREFFGGSLTDLQRAREVADGMALLRKEFIIDERQIYEARVAGADAVLLIAACLSEARCGELAAVAHSVGLEVLLEVHTPADLGYVGENIDMLGVNNRNLGTFVTDLDNSFRMAEAMQRYGNDIVLVSESGLSDAETIKKLKKAGFQGFLMGETFMKTEDPARALKRLIDDMQ